MKSQRTLWTRIVAVTALCWTVALVIAAFFIEEPLRRWMEREINAPLHGYSIRIGGLDLHPLTFSLTLEQVVVRQDAHPEPPLAEVPRIDGGIEWRALLSGAVLARVRVERPVAHLDLPQLREEMNDATPLAEKGWQEAFENVSPIDVDDVRVIGGELSYLGERGATPLRIDRLNVRASNIRNVRSEAGTFPSPLHVDARVLGSAPLEVDGAADFLASPRPAVRADFELGKAPLEKLAPAGQQFGLALRGGHVAARGTVESTASADSVVLHRVSIEGVNADYVETTTAPTPEKEVAKVAARKATTAAAETKMRVRIDELEIEKSTLGFVNATVEPHYRLFVDVANASLHDFSNGKKRKDAPFSLDGKFMDSGSLRLRGAIRPDHDGPDLNVALKLENTEIRALNDALRAHGHLDVVAGQLSVYSEVTVRERQVSGYVKPLIVNLDVYDKTQDGNKPLGNELYQGAVGAVATVLQNQPRDQVATVTPISGSLDAVDANGWRSFVLLLRNAFVEAIRPGFERSAAG